MWDLLVEIILERFFGSSKESKESQQSKVDLNVPSPSERRENDKIRDEALQYYNTAEQNRKAGHVKKAEEEYWESIKRWNRSKGRPAPAPFRKLAKLYYHTGYTEKATEVIDSFLDPSHWPQDLVEEDGSIEHEEMEVLRERFEKGEFRRLKNKYEEKPTGGYP